MGNAKSKATEHDISSSLNEKMSKKRIRREQAKKKTDIEPIEEDSEITVIEFLRNFLLNILIVNYACDAQGVTLHSKGQMSNNTTVSDWDFHVMVVLFDWILMYFFYIELETYLFSISNVGEFFCVYLIHKRLLDSIASFVLFKQSGGYFVFKTFTA